MQLRSSIIGREGRSIGATSAWMGISTEPDTRLPSAIGFSASPGGVPAVTAGVNRNLPQIGGLDVLAHF